MANLKEQAKWEEGIYQYEITDPLQGGEDGIDNVQGKQLANRTLYLRQELEQHQAAVENPHKVTAEQIGVYTKQETDEKIEDSYNWALVDESKARNLLDVLGVRAVHSDEPATLEEIKKVMEILHKKINPDGIPDFSGLRLCDYLDLPEINDGETTYKWNGECKNLRVMIAGFNLYKYIGDESFDEEDNKKNHIVFSFRNCVLQRSMDGEPSYGNGYLYSHLSSYLENAFLKGLKAVLGDYLYMISLLYSEKSRYDWNKFTIFLPTERDVWGYHVWSEKQWDCGSQCQLPIFRESSIYKVKRDGNNMKSNWWVASPSELYDKTFCAVKSDISPLYYTTEKKCGVSPMFCII